MVFPDARSLGCVRAPELPRSTSTTHLRSRRAFREQEPVRLLLLPCTGSAGAQLEQPDEHRGGGMGWVQRGQALGLVLPISTINTLKERINTLSIKFTDEAQLG